MMRLVLLLAMVAGFALVFATHSPGLLALGLLLGIAGLFGFVFSLAAARVSANARPDTAMASVEDLAALRKPPQAPTARNDPPAPRPPQNRF